MINQKNFNLYDDKYDIYYLSQASQQNQIGNGLENDQLSFYRGKPWQRGFGNIFTRFGKAYGIPLLKYVGKKLFNYGLDVANDIKAGQNIKDSLKKNIKRTAADTLDDVKSKIQQGQSRKKRNKRRKIVRKKQFRNSRSKNKVKKPIKSKRKKKKSRKVKNIFDKYVS